MKVLFLSTWYPTSTNPNSGVFIKEHARSIKFAGNDIYVIALIFNTSSILFQKKIIDFIDENGVKTILIQVDSRFQKFLYYFLPYHFFLLKKVFNKAIKGQFDPDIIHSNVIFPSAIVGYWLSKQLKKPHIITEHWSRIQGFIDKNIFSRTARNAYKNAEFILPVSLFLKNNLKSILPELDVNKCVIVNNVIDSETFSYTPKTKSKTINFSAIATWANKRTPDKIPELFIDAIAQVQKSTTHKISLTLIGGGDRVPELVNLCHTKDIDIIATGYLEKKNICKHLQLSDFLVHASTIETFGVVVAESLLCGTPVICSKVGALPELINDTNGVLCENTLESWINGINKAINTTFDHQQISNKYSNMFALKTIGEKINTIYIETCKKNK